MMSNCVFSLYVCLLSVSLCVFPCLLVGHRFPHLYPVDKLRVPSGQEDDQQQQTHGRTDADPHSRPFSGGAATVVKVEVRRRAHAHPSHHQENLAIQWKKRDGERARETERERGMVVAAGARIGWVSNANALHRRAETRQQKKKEEEISTRKPFFVVAPFGEFFSAAPTRRADGRTGKTSTACTACSAARAPAWRAPTIADDAGTGFCSATRARARPSSATTPKHHNPRLFRRKLRVDRSRTGRVRGAPAQDCFPARKKKKPKRRIRWRTWKWLRRLALYWCWYSFSSSSSVNVRVAAWIVVRFAEGRQGKEVGGERGMTHSAVGPHRLVCRTSPNDASPPFSGLGPPPSSPPGRGALLVRCSLTETTEQRRLPLIRRRAPASCRECSCSFSFSRPGLFSLNVCF